VNRKAVDLRACHTARVVQTPWGPADFATEYAPGLVLYSTPGHGGFHVSAEWLAQMPEPYRSAVPFTQRHGRSGPGWYEEDCDWSIVALSFPQFFTAPEIETAREMWSWMLERQAKDSAPCAHCSPEVVLLVPLKLAQVAPHLVKIDLPNSKGEA